MDDNKQLVIARILGGGTIDKQGLLHVGDVILEVNGVEVYTPEDLQTEISKSADSVTLKIGPRDSPDKLITHEPQVTTNGISNGVPKKLTVRFFFDWAIVFTNIEGGGYVHIIFVLLTEPIPHGYCWDSTSIFHYLSLLCISL